MPFCFLVQKQTYLPPSTRPSAAFSRKLETLSLPCGARPMYSNALTWIVSTRDSQCAVIKLLQFPNCQFSSLEREWHLFDSAEQSDRTSKTWRIWINKQLLASPLYEWPYVPQTSNGSYLRKIGLDPRASTKARGNLRQDPYPKQPAWRKILTQLNPLAKLWNYIISSRKKYE